ncbi:hypothetical protein MLD38_038454 [Melastoma candidum]|uniref:Uncharacterized protein n=1 Tax=Melastoma candidum TaxID=119954 RepID=A0ACB9L193_9MYRT|nr:hypothetical protein MLD38_038454 [Melastoma candidum]
MRFTPSLRLGLSAAAAAAVILVGAGLDVSLAHEGGSCPFSGHYSPAPSHAEDGHQCGDHGHLHHDHHHEHHGHDVGTRRAKLPEELAEEEDLRLYGFGSGFDHDHDYDGHGHGHHHHHLHEDQHSGGSTLSGFSLWLQALSCSLLVSMASLICLILLPLLFVKGKPSKEVVDSLALFGAGAMLGDAFLHQLPHAFGADHSHSHDHHAEGIHISHFGHEHHHNLEELSLGMSVLGGILLFLVVEKLVRYVEEKSGGEKLHHHHHHKSTKKLNHVNDPDDTKATVADGKNEKPGSTPSEGMNLNEFKDDSLDGDELKGNGSLRKRNVFTTVTKQDENVDSSSTGKSLEEKESTLSSKNLIFGYLNLFSDGVHNFTDGMSLGSAFLLHGSIGGWSRTLFLLAHELPQEVGDFGILVRSGFSVPKALFFNFLSALVALAGTALALLIGQEGGQSSVIEGFTAADFTGFGYGCCPWDFHCRMKVIQRVVHVKAPTLSFVHRCSQLSVGIEDWVFPSSGTSSPADALSTPPFKAGFPILRLLLLLTCGNGLGFG